MDRGMNWISVEDRLPENEEFEECASRYLVYVGKYGHGFGMYMNGFWYKNYCSLYIDVTHWMPLTPPSNKQEESHNSK
jgi:hypothetical protein